MKCQTLLIVAASVLVLETVSQAEIKIIVEHNSNEDATSGFKFKDVPSPSGSDAATQAMFTVVYGEKDANSGDVGKLHDGRVPTDDDQPSGNFFFNAGTAGGRLLVDLGNAIDVRQVNTYSWHPGTRGPQVYKLYVGDASAAGFDARPTPGTDPEQRGWKLVAKVDTRPKEGESGGQYGVSISDSGGTLGKYRYLLFDISRTEDTDAFGNTFYSEIDVIDAHAPMIAETPVTQAVAKTSEAEGGKYQFTIDTSDAPDLTEWADKSLAPVVQEWYPKIVRMLPSEGYEAPTRVTITFRDGMKVPAATGGSRISCNSDWFRRNLKGEARGSVVHEMVHVVQQYGKARRNNPGATHAPGWLVEGIADYIRWNLYEPETKGAEITQRNISRARYDANYRITGNFLNWVTETYDKDIVKTLNAAAREGQYTEDLWKDSTRKTVQELGDEWKKAVEEKVAAEGRQADGSSAGSSPSPEASPAGKPFAIQQQDGTAWLVRPNGERFFSFGVCVVTMGASRKEFDPDNPGYAAWQHYGDSNQWAEATLKRLKAWGFTTVGGWSDFQVFKQCRDTDVAFAPVLHIGSTAGAPWWDMWDPKIVGRMDEVAREQILALRDDPRVIGYYSDNEMGWWNGILFKMTLEQAPTSGQRRRLIELLRQTYRNEWSELLHDFEPAPGLESWQQLDQHGTLFLRPGGNGIRTMRRFLALLAERYYSLVHDLIRKYDPRALILGDRYQSFFYPEVARACAPYVDAVSSNLNASWNDGTFARFYLETLHALTGKPVLVGEFYMAARDNRSGNKNNRGVYPVLATQKERAAGFRNTLHSLLRIPYVVGADWFQYYDEPTHGRFDGENFNFGLVDIHDRPYEALTAAASALDLASLKKQPPRARPDASQGVPPAPRNPLGEFKPTLALKQWDRERGFVKPVSEFPLADLYVCWDKKAIYLGLYAQDVVEDAFYRSKVVPRSDRATWVVSVGGSTRPIHARIGAGMEPIADDPAVRVVNVSGLNGDVRNVVGMELPAKLFGKDRFKPGDTVGFASTLWTHCQAYRVEWRGQFKLRDERRIDSN